eukprot:1147430-Pelagomonas_calceolata.AAC.4
MLWLETAQQSKFAHTHTPAAPHPSGQLRRPWGRRRQEPGGRGCGVAEAAAAAAAAAAVICATQVLAAACLVKQQWGCVCAPQEHAAMAGAPD